MPVIYPTPADVFNATAMTNVDVWPAITWLITYLDNAAKPAIPYFNDQWGLTGKPNEIRKWKAIRRGGGDFSQGDINCLLIQPTLDSFAHGLVDRAGGVNIALHDVVGQNAQSDEALEMPWRRLVVLVNSLYYVRNGLEPDGVKIWNKFTFLGATRLVDQRQQGYYGLTLNGRMILAPGRF